MIIPVLVILAIITFLTSIPLWEFSVAKYLLQGISASLLICAIVFSIVTAIASH